MTAIREFDPHIKRDFIKKVTTGVPWNEAKYTGQFNTEISRGRNPKIVPFSAMQDKVRSGFLADIKTFGPRGPSFKPSTGDKAAYYATKAIDKIATPIANYFPAIAEYAPAVGRVAGKIAAPIGMGLSLYDIGKAGKEGYGAYSASRDAAKNERYQQEKYGTIEAATRTRKQR